MCALCCLVFMMFWRLIILEIPKINYDLFYRNLSRRDGLASRFGWISLHLFSVPMQLSLHMFPDLPEVLAQPLKRWMLKAPLLFLGPTFSRYYTVIVRPMMTMSVRYIISVWPYPQPNGERLRHISGPVHLSTTTSTRYINCFKFFNRLK